MLNTIRHKIAESIVGGRIVKSVPNISFTDEALHLLRGEPKYFRLEGNNAFEKEYRENPVLASVINLKANYASNAVVSVRNLKNGEIITDKQYRESKNLDRIVKKMFALKNNPNPLQSTKEYLALGSIFKDVFGNGFQYANSATDDVNIRDIGFLWHVWPQYMKPIPTGKYFDQIREEGIISGWTWEYHTTKRDFKPKDILHRKEPNIKLKSNDDLILGESRQVSLAWALSNIRIAYESRNVIARERGMRAIISSAEADGLAGSMPMDDNQKLEVQQDLKTNYGFMEGQNQFMVTRHNINVHHIDQDVRKLGLLGEIQSDAIVVAERYGVPETLIKLYIKGATFENQDTAERRMYQNTTIPEENDRWEDLNNWLKCRDFGYEYIVSFNHIPVLQKNEKDKAETNKFISTQYKEMFLTGAVTYNEWLIAVGLPTRENGNRYITDMTFEEIQKIKGNYTVNQSLDKQE